MKILITGGAGFVPSCTAEKLLKDPSNTVVLIDNFLTGKPENIPNHPNCKFIKGDVNKRKDLEPVMTSYQFDYVYHYAAVVGVIRTLENPVSVLDDIQGIKNVLDLAKSTGVKRVFFSSSSEVYGEPVHLPQNEHTTPLNSRLPYAVVKNVGEAYFRSYKQEFDLDYTIFRFFNTYGPKQSEDFVMSKFIKLALRGEDIPLYGDGSQTRTFCYIEDNTDFCTSAITNTNTINKVFNVGNDLITTIKELAEMVIQKTNSSSKIVYLPPLPDGDMTRRQPDITKLRDFLSRDLTPLEIGMDKVIAFEKTRI